MSNETTRPLSYGTWLSALTQKPFGVGREGVFLTLSTVVFLVLEFALLAKPFFAMIPPGRYPRILLMLPFLIGAAVFFLVLSRFFHIAYERRLTRAV